MARHGTRAISGGTVVSPRYLDSTVPPGYCLYTRSLVTVACGDSQSAIAFNHIHYGRVPHTAPPVRCPGPTVAARPRRARGRGPR